MSARRLAWLGLLLVLLAARAPAEPYLAVANGYKCGQCHVNPTGGGERTAFGEIFSQTTLPAEHVDTGADVWTGAINRFISLGGDGRYQFEAQQVPGQTTANQFDLEQARVYLSANVIPDRVLFYADEQIAPGSALNREVWGMLWSADHTWYFKAGQMYLPFGLRLQDQTAFVNTVSNIQMSTPDRGVELGYEHGHWDAQLAVSNGTAGAAPTSNGKQESLQLTYVQNRWRLGAAANFNDSNPDGSRETYALFGGVHTGPIAWLAEVDYLNDHSLPSGPGGGQKQLGGLLEANYSPWRGHNLKVSYEYFDPDREVSSDQQTRWSFVYEWTPIQFVQIRAGARLYDGISQQPTQNQRLYFVELHGFF